MFKKTIHVLYSYLYKVFVRYCFCSVFFLFEENYLIPGRHISPSGWRRFQPRWHCYLDKFVYIYIYKGQHLRHWGRNPFSPSLYNVLWVCAIFQICRPYSIGKNILRFRRQTLHSTYVSFKFWFILLQNAKGRHTSYTFWRDIHL